MDIEDVINKYFQQSSTVAHKEIKTGAINQTYHLTANEDKAKKEFILQKMKSIFDVSIMEDVEFITKYLSSKKVLIQKVIRTKDGKSFVQDGALWWRLLSYIPGKTFNSIPSLKHAREAGRLLGEFHNALTDCDYEFKFKLPHLYDTNFVMKKLENTLEKNKDTKKYLELKDIAKNILSIYKNLPRIITLPNRIIHGDLKINNVLFDNASEKALTLIDLDTLMHSTIVVELGDALRSWCMPGGEDVDMVSFDPDVYNIALDGYISTAKFLTPEEKNSIPYGVKLITLELTARFVIDAFEENYFILDSSKYDNLFEQNKKRAENQLEFFKKFSEIKH